VTTIVNSGLQIREQAYRRSSQANGYFVTGFSFLILMTTLIFVEVWRQPLLSALNPAAIGLFALSGISGLMKLEYCVAVRGADYTVGLTEANQINLTVRESSAMRRDLYEVVERLTNRASAVYRLRNWLLVLGILVVIASRVLGTVLV
jgi:hypothetical protein